jgi:SAM-dependent methyltransferase
MVDPNDVLAAYRLILGREPENEEIVAVHAQHAGSLEDLRQTFLASSEFLNRVPNTVRYRPLTWPPIHVETHCTDQQLSAMIKHIEANWTRLGRTEPYWSVRAEEAFRSPNIHHTKREFYESGQIATEGLRRTAERCGIDPGTLSRCYELGCGVGRSTLWLAGMFRQVIAADISLPHLTIARQAVECARHNNVEFTHLNTFAAFHDVPEFDALVSLIVLQHNPPPVIAYLLRMLLGKLRPNGIAYLQVPTYSPNYRFSADEYLSNATDSGTIEMHVLPQHKLFEILAEMHCRPLEIREDSWTNDYNTISNSVLAVKV